METKCNSYLYCMKLNSFVMKTKLLKGMALAAMLLLLFNQLNAQDMNFYKKKWAEADSAEKKGLPKTALEIVDKINAQAQKDKLSEQVIKSYIFRLKYKNAIEENAFEKLLGELDSTVKTAVFPDDAVMHLMLADMYWWYYQNNRWKFMERSNTVNFKNDDMQTWTLDHLVAKIIDEYDAALSNAPGLQQIPISKYPELIPENTKPQELRPTLYDFIAHKAIDFYSNTEISLTRPADYFQIKEDFFFEPAEKFVKEEIMSSDTLSLHFQAQCILQELLKFRLANPKEANALADADLKRLVFVYRHSVSENKHKLYFDALQNLKSKFTSDYAAAEILLTLAKHYVERSSNYNPLDNQTDAYKTNNTEALALVNTIIEKYPKTNAAEHAKSLKITILSRSLYLTSEHTMPIKKTFAAKLDYRNSETVYIRLAKIDRKKFERVSEDKYGEELYDALFSAADKVYDISKTLPADKDYNNHSVEVLLNGADAGLYLVFFSDNKEFTYNKGQAGYQKIIISDIAYIQQQQPDGGYKVTVMNRSTGDPMPNVKCEIWYQKYNYTLRKYQNITEGTLTTDAKGTITIKPKNTTEWNYYYINFSTATDFLTTQSSLSLYPTSHTPLNETSTFLFTDRAIYRPGQTVYFKGIQLQMHDDNKHVVNKNTPVHVELYDVNSQKVSELDLKTNDYGTFSGTFTLPTGLLNGNFRIYTTYGEKYIKVEEYKRPQFEVTLNKFDGNYLLDDEITVKGKAVSYAGAGLSDAEVKFKISRTPRWRGWWYWTPPSPTIEIAHGNVKTNEKGEYEFKFNAVPDLSMPKNEFTYFGYSISVDVTDINGETQSSAGNINVGYRALQVSLPISGTLNSADKTYSDDKHNTMEVGTTNYNGEFVAAQGEIKIFELKDNAEALRNRLWTRPDKQFYTKDEWAKTYPGNIFSEEDNLQKLEKGAEVWKTTFNTKTDKNIRTKFVSDLKTGHYVAEITSKDAFGNEVANKHFFSVINSDSKKMPYSTTDLFMPLTYFCEPGEKAQWLIGSSEKVTVLYEIEHKDKIVYSEYLKLDNEQKIISLPIEEKHRGNVSVNFVFIKNNRIYNHPSTIYVSHSDKKLDIEFVTFRDKLFPGEKEQWKIKIKGTKGEKVAAEMLATLYDASLDVFAKNYWSFDIFSSYYQSRTWSTGTFGHTQAGSYKKNIDEPHYATSLYYPSFNWYGFSYWSYSYRNFDMEDNIAFSVVTGSANGGNRPKGRRNGLPETEKKAESPVSMNGDFESEESDEFIADSPSVEQSKPESVVIKPKEEMSDVKVRTNFSETAFFYPHLETDEDGNILIDFTIPESLTRWKMMGFAVTQDLKYGFINNELITQKDLMVVPNAPRFFREFDKMTFPVKISNVSDVDLSGTIQLEMLDALTMKPLDNVLAKGEATQKPFTVKAGSNSLITWNLDIPDGVGVIAYKVVAKTDKFSDGEQKPIPVLTNRMLVTESLPLPVRGKETKNFEFTKLINSGSSSTLKHHKLTLEYTSNPAWYAVQALPYMIEYPYECTEQTFSRYYANSLASNIANSSPKIKAIFDSWKNTENSEALLSNLEKNQELKYALLEETPWVLDGKDETERKKRVGVLFDLNRMGNEMETALRKIQKAQSSNGAWPWFNGMPESRYITQYLVTGFGRLDQLGVKEIRGDQKTWNMLTKAVGYLDIRIDEDYDWLKRHYTEKEMKENHLSYDAIHYLYGRSYFTDIEIPARSKEAFDYYKGQAQKYWLTQGQYMQGMLALSLHRFGDAKVPADILKSLKEHSTSHDELGMYWKNNVAGYYWYNAPIEFQALMIEAFDEVSNDQTAVYDLKVWLLKQKQTQDWKTTRATAEAVYALLRRGGNWLESDKLVEIKLAGKVIDPTKLDNVKIEAGTGYFKTSWSGSDIKPDMGKVTVTKTDEGIAWGALYWQYFENLDKITPHETPLKLKKQLFIERDTDRGKVIEPISDKAQLQVGDKIIVRMELRTDRAMEYIHLKDMRASGFEPINVISRYKWQDGLGYYESTKDASTNFFIEYLPKGTFVFEYPLRVTHKGDFSNGITTIQCMYAPEFTSHSEGIRVTVK